MTPMLRPAFAVSVLAQRLLLGGRRTFVSQTSDRSRSEQMRVGPPRLVYAVAAGWAAWRRLHETIEAQSLPMDTDPVPLAVDVVRTLGGALPGYHQFIEDALAGEERNIPQALEDTRELAVHVLCLEALLVEAQRRREPR